MRASSRRSSGDNIPSSGSRGGGGLSGGLSETNEAILASQWKKKKGKKLPVQRWDDDSPIEYRDSSSNQIQYKYREKLPTSVPTEQLTPLFILNQYKQGQLKKTFLPTKVYECGLSSHPMQHKPDRALEILEEYVGSKNKQGVNTTFRPSVKLPRRKKKSTVKRKLFSIKKHNAQQYSNESNTGNGTEQPGQNKGNNLELGADRGKSHRYDEEKGQIDTRHDPKSGGTSNVDTPRSGKTTTPSTVYTNKSGTPGGDDYNYKELKSASVDIERSFSNLSLEEINDLNDRLASFDLGDTNFDFKEFTDMFN